jgi:hypothetical protein
MNLNTTSGMQFDWRYYEPFVYFAIVFLDANDEINDRRATLFYSFWTFHLVGQYY